MPEEYYHGTGLPQALDILTDGFRLGFQRHGRFLGNGVYLTPDPSQAAAWSPDSTILACRLAAGTRLLWLEPDFDRAVVQYLKREFGHALLALGPDFGKTLPKNKQLRKHELVALCNHIFHTETYGQHRITSYWSPLGSLARLGRQLRLHQFDGIGDRSGSLRWGGDQIMVFDPARVMPLSVCTG